MTVILFKGIRDIWISLRTPPPGNQKILSKFFKLDLPTSPPILFFQKFRPPLPRDAPEGKKNIFTIKLMSFLVSRRAKTGYNGLLAHTSIYSPNGT